jgi:hypothetical protein
LPSNRADGQLAHAERQILQAVLKSRGLWTDIVQEEFAKAGYNHTADAEHALTHASVGCDAAFAFACAASVEVAGMPYRILFCPTTFAGKCSDMY